MLREKFAREKLFVVHRCPWNDPIELLETPETPWKLPTERETEGRDMAGRELAARCGPAKAAGVRRANDEKSKSEGRRSFIIS